MKNQLDTLAELLAKAGKEADDARYYGGPPLPYLPEANALANAAVNFLRDNLPAIREQSDEVERLRAAVTAFVDRFDTGSRADTDYVADLMRAALNSTGAA